MKTLRVIIAGGGTGGHIFPAVAIGHALQRLQPGTELLFVGAKGKMEMEKVPQEGFRIIGLEIAGFNRSNLLKNTTLPFKLIKSLMQAAGILRNFNPDVVVGVGGYASFPILNAAQRRGIPTLIQEQNSFAGKSNKILGRKAAAICVAYDKMEQFFPKEKLIFTGNPVRKSITRSTITREEALAAFQLQPDKQTLLIVGGSLGAKSINEAIAAGLSQLAATGIQVVWQTGNLFYDQALAAAKGFRDIHVHAFIREMDKAYAAADMVISRAGALAIAELCIVAKPVIFVPYPFAAEDHQTSNAMSLVAHNAAEMVRDSDASVELIPKLLKLMDDAVMQDLMRNNLQRLAITDADERIANKIIELSKTSGR